MDNIQPIWADQYFKNISNSKMGLNLSRGTPIKYYSSDRITQIIGNGLVTLIDEKTGYGCLLYTSPSPRDRTRSRMPSSA